jgi:hypothetical protein
MDDNDWVWLAIPKGLTRSAAIVDVEGLILF